ncbi:MAG: hypothetical protein WD805_03970 [Gaiellaceae bacterium]
MAVACVSLFVALSGAGTAAVVTLKRNQVKSIHIANGQVKRPDIAPNAVSSAKVADGSLLLTDFAAGQLRAGPQGTTGLPGPPAPVIAAASLGDTPPPLSGTVLAATSVETVDPANLFVTAQLGSFPGGTGAFVQCSAVGPCTMTLGVYVVGAPVPGAGLTVHAAANQTRNVKSAVAAGIAPDVPPGLHSVQFVLATSGSVQATGHSALGQVQAIATDPS